MHTFVLEEHRPLGCTVEESLAQEDAVFVTSVKAGGFAEAAGLQVGDVDALKKLNRRINARVARECIEIAGLSTESLEPRSVDEVTS